MSNGARSLIKKIIARKVKGEGREMRKTHWQHICEAIPEILPRLQNLRKENSDLTCFKAAQILNQEFTERLDSSNVKIKPWHLRSVLLPGDKQFTSPNDRMPGASSFFSPKEKRALILLKKGPTTITILSEDPEINIPKEDVFGLIDDLRAKGFDVEQVGDEFHLEREPFPGATPSLPPLSKKLHIEALFLSDLCLGLKEQQGDILATCLKIGEERGVFYSVIAGNLIAGKPLPKRRKEYFLFSAEEQAEYFTSHFPGTPFKTYFINGPRELSFNEKPNRKKAAEAAEAAETEEASIETLLTRLRDDIRYLADEKKILSIGRPESKIAVVNLGDKAAYTKSYTLRGTIQNFQESVFYAFEHSEPLQAVIAGGVHSGILLPRQFPVASDRFNDFDGVALPSLCRITPSQTVNIKRGGSPVLGCLILGANFDKDGKFQGFTYAFYDLTAYFKNNDYLDEVKIDESLPEEAKKVLLRLKNGPARYGELSREIGKSIPHAKKVIEDLKAKGYAISFKQASKAFVLERPLKKEFKALDTKKLFTTTVKFAVISDTHLGNKGDRPDLIEMSYKIAEDKKADFVLHCGDLYEGEGAFKGQIRELKIIGADAQRKYGLSIWPKSKIPTIFISGSGKSHERSYWEKVGHDIIEAFVESAKHLGHKFWYLGGPQGTFEFKGLKFEMHHPSRGMTKGETYRLQERIEMLVSAMNLQKGVKATFKGHLHRAVFMLYKGMAGFLVPALEENTEYIDAMDKLAELGMWIVEFAFDDKKNLTKVELEYIPFEPNPEHLRHLNLDEVLNRFQRG